MKKISLLGASGSIGKQTIDVVLSHPELFELQAIAVGTNIDYANELISLFPNLKLVAVQNQEDIPLVNHEHVMYGMTGLEAVATLSSVDVVVSAIIGNIGLQPTIKAIESKKDIALANKETLVTAGHLIMPLAQKYNVNITPIDSEHCAIKQCLNGENLKEVNKLILTASGGSFRDLTIEQLEHVTLKDALKHPNWSMGKKITIDSATMFNKGLEIIEAHHLFNLDYDKIDVVIHKESIIHSMVEFIDHSVIAQLGTVDMRLPIQYALTYPNRYKLNEAEYLNLAQIGQLNFSEVDFQKYPAVKLAYQVGKLGHSMPTVYNSANEEAVNLFLQGKIKFLQIFEIVNQMVEQHKIVKNPNLEQILTIDKQVRQQIKREWKC